MAYLGQQGLAVATIESYLAALRHFKLLANPSDMSPSLQSPYIKLIMRGIRRANAQKQPSLIRLPITAGILAKIKAALAENPSEYSNVLTWAACCTGFFGFMRCGEFLCPDSGQFDPQTHLALSDVTIVEDKKQRRIHLQIKASKTDQFRTGATVILGSTGAGMCPVAALLDYLNRRGGAPGPLFINEDKSPLRRHKFVGCVQQALTTAGLQGSDFKGHSFRIGAATAASQAGVPETTIKVLGRWQSMAYQRYIRLSPSELAEVAGKLVP